MIKKTPLIALITLLLMSFFVTTAHADGVATRRETVCDTTSYGVRNCREVIVQIPTHDATKIPTALPNIQIVIAGLGIALVLSTAAYIYTN